MNSNPSDAQEAQSTDKDAIDDKQKLFPIVGIGASAGGLEAFTQLLEYLPIDTGMGFVLIQHMKPDRKSLLCEILARTTQMPVVEVLDCMMVEPNCVYIIPPNTKMTLERNLLRLMPRDRVTGYYMSVDAFFNSLAQERGDKAIGVVLSGADGDGATGLKAIKIAGGITFAQCEATAQVSGMPNTAVATGHVDFILSPENIAKALAKIALHPYVTYLEPEKTLEELAPDSSPLKSLFTLLRAETGTDFTHYKHTTIKRRIWRRMALYKLDNLEDYVTYLQSNPKEVKALAQEVLIHVTSFFRDAEVFQALKEQVFGRLMPASASGEPIRIWVAGCSTGEEVYSIAICLQEYLDTQVIVPKVMIFGTDISETVIEKARSGIYPPSFVEEQVSSDRLRRFFVKVEGGYEICKPLRQMCIFAKQNILADPPFSQLDLISCRNVLIYLGRTLQKQVLPMFHYSLKPTGFLLLGTSESTGDCADLFAQLDKKQRIYSRKLTATRLNTDYFISNYLEQKVNIEQMNSDTSAGFDLQKEADRIVWHKYAPPGVIVNNDLEIIQFRGDTSPYLSPAPGKPSFNLIAMARVNLRSELRSALAEAKRLNISVKKSNISTASKEQSQEIALEVIPLKAPSVKESYFLVLFAEIALPASPVVNEEKVKPARGKQTATSSPELIQLKQQLLATQQELAATKDYLQLVIQEHEGVTQELTTANEEILSSNEELQSTNEELQTAKEEIQATNEELTTTNDELQNRILESTKINSDLRNLLSSVNIPIVMLGNDLKIRRFTPVAEKVFNLISTDVGRPLSHIKPNIDVPDLEQSIAETIDTLVIKKQEVQDTEGHWYELFIRPYKTLENKIDGAVVMLVDIDTLKSSSEQLERARNYAEAIIETIPEPLLVLDTNLRVNAANRSFYSTFQVTPAQTENRSVFELGNGQWNIGQLRSLLQEVLPHNNQIDNFEVEHTFESVGRKTMLLKARKIQQTDEQQTILLVIQDITERKLFEQKREQLLITEQSARSNAEAANRAKDEFLSVVSHELRNPLNSMLGWTQLLRERSFDAVQTAQALAMVERSAKSQLKLIEDILDTSRITVGKLQLSVRAISLLPVIESALDIARPSAETKNIHLETVLEPRSIKVSGDPDRLQQVIWNLLSNAIKFTPAEGRVTIKLERTGSFAQIQVSDTGQGISADFLPHVFERFRQANSSSTRTQGGLGLGLSIVYHLVELHGGTVWAESPGIGQGATFKVQLPLLKTSKKKQTNVPPPRQQPTDPAILNGLHVLVVDDEAGMRELLKTILEEYAAQVTVVASARDAIASLTANPSDYDVLLSDIGMPNEDGYMLIRQIRQLSAEDGGQIPAAALTAYVRADEQRKIIAAGFQKHIAKPVEPDQLALIIKELAQRE